MDSSWLQFTRGGFEYSGLPSLEWFCLVTQYNIFLAWLNPCNF